MVMINSGGGGNNHAGCTHLAWQVILESFLQFVRLTCRFLARSEEVSEAKEEEAGEAHETPSRIGPDWPA